MWLPKDERKLIEAYYLRIGSVEDRKVFRASSLLPILRSRKVKRAARRIKEYHQIEEPDTKKERDTAAQRKRENKQYIADEKRLSIANKALQARKLVEIQPHQGERNVFVIGLTLEGYDLGRKYSNCFIWSGLWFQEYRNHWIWLIAGFFGGVLGSLVSRWLLSND